MLIAANLNAFLKAMDIYMGTSGATLLDRSLGVALMLLVLESARRTVGAAIPIMVVVLMGYIYTGDAFPAWGSSAE